MPLLIALALLIAVNMTAKASSIIPMPSLGSQSPGADSRDCRAAHRDCRQPSPVRNSDRNTPDPTGGADTGSVSGSNSASSDSGPTAVESSGNSALGISDLNETTSFPPSAGDSAPIGEAVDANGLAGLGIQEPDPANVESVAVPIGEDLSLSGAANDQFAPLQFDPAETGSFGTAATAPEPSPLVLVLTGVGLIAFGRRRLSL